MRVADTSQYGVVELGSRHDIVSFQEKPDSAEAISNLANTGIYVLEPEVFEYIPEHTFFDFAKDVFPRLLAAGEELAGYEGSFYWSDIGNLEAYRAAQHDALSRKVRLNIPGEQLTEGLWVERGARIHPTVDIDGRVVVSRDAVIGRGGDHDRRRHRGERLLGTVWRHHQAEHSPSGILCRRGCLPGRLHSGPRLRRAGRRADQGRGAGPSVCDQGFSSTVPKPPRSIAQPTSATNLFARG